MQLVVRSPEPWHGWSYLLHTECTLVWLWGLELSWLVGTEVFQLLPLAVAPLATQGE